MGAVAINMSQEFMAQLRGDGSVEKGIRAEFHDVIILSVCICEKHPSFVGTI